MMVDRSENKKCEDMQIFVQSGLLHMVFSGNFIDKDCENTLELLQNKLSGGIKTIKFEAQNLQNWDSSLLLIIFKTIEIIKSRNLDYDLSALPQNLQKLIKLAFSVDRKPEHNSEIKLNFFANIGFNTITLFNTIKKFFYYMQDVFSALARFFSFRSAIRQTDFYSALEECGPKAIGIVSLISFLVGLILAFVGAVQLQMFGAQIYVASLVTIGMCRIMGAIMVGIIIAGRTGSAYAATIGTMQVNEELDALQTMGISRMDFLVLPRMLALIIAMPVLTMLSDIMGMVGGAFVGVFLMDLPAQEYWKYALNAFTLKNFLVGVFHGFCFGIIISLCGCYSGLNCGRNADSVGLATTKSVVCAIVWMIVITGIITVICQELGI